MNDAEQNSCDSADATMRSLDATASLSENDPDESPLRLVDILGVARGFAWLFLGVAAVIWWCIIGDIHTALAYSNSFCVLSPQAADFLFFVSIFCCAAAALISVANFVWIPACRKISVVIFVLSLALIPAAVVVAAYMGAMTVHVKERGA